MRQASDPDFAPPVEEGMIYAFQDEKGETINLEFLGLILHNDRRYGFFVPDAEHDEAPGEVMILEKPSNYWLMKRSLLRSTRSSSVSLRGCMTFPNKFIFLSNN